MATTKIWKVESRIDNAINYIKNKEKTKNDCYEFGMDNFENIRDVLMYATNADKTEKQFYVTGINCKAEMTKEQFEAIAASGSISDEYAFGLSSGGYFVDDPEA